MAQSLTIEEFRDRVKGTMVQCKMCSYRGHSIVAHLQAKHDVSVGQYKKQFGSDAVIVSPVVSELLRSMDRKAFQTDRLEEFLSTFQSEATTTQDLFTESRPLFKPASAETAHLVPEVDPGFRFDKKSVRAILYALAKGKNAYLEGPTGCGKTDQVIQVHAQIGRPLVRVNMNGDVTAGSFIGATEADPSKGTYWRYGDLPFTMRHGITLLVDEIDYTPPSIAAVLNPVLEKRRTLHLAETGETIAAASGFNVIGTGNTGGKGDSTGVYTGTEVLNTALLDRFSVKLVMGYLPEKEEILMLTGRFPTTDGSFIQHLVQAATEIRKAFAEGTLPLTVSTRKLIEVLQMDRELGTETALELGILGWLDADNRPVVAKILENHGFKV